MDDLKVLALHPGRRTRTLRRPFCAEAELRRLIVRHARALFQLTVLAVEYPVQGNGDARIAAIALDLSRRPVIIEFKRVAMGTAIFQGLFYLDWLVSHRESFTELVMDRFGVAAARRVDWSASRVLCIAETIGELEEAVARQIGKRAELIALRRLTGGVVIVQTPGISHRFGRFARRTRSKPRP